MATMRNLATEFPQLKGLTTYLGAHRRIDNAVKLMGDEAHTQYGFLWIILQRGNTFIPIAILNDTNRHLALFLANRGIGVTTS